MPSSKVAKKARHAAKQQIDIEFDSQLGVLKRARDHKLFKANEAYSKGLQEVMDARAVARKEAWDEYEASRRELLASLASQESASQASD